MTPTLYLHLPGAGAGATPRVQYGFALAVTFLTLVFICPSSQGERDTFKNKTVHQRSNFTAIPLNLTYSYSCPFPTRGAMDQGFKMNYTLTSDFAVMADINPGRTGGDPPDDVTKVQPTASQRDLKNANSNNHNGDGQNVLYADGHVEFKNTPFSGMQRTQAGNKGSFRDNIYTAKGNPYSPISPTTGHATRQGPQDALDSVMYPHDGGGPGVF